MGGRIVGRPGGIRPVVKAEVEEEGIRSGMRLIGREGDDGVARGVAVAGRRGREGWMDGWKVNGDEVMYDKSMFAACVNLSVKRL